MDMAWPNLVKPVDTSRRSRDNAPGGVTVGASAGAGDSLEGGDQETKPLAGEGRGPTGGFEGPEKTLEIEFDPDLGHDQGLRAVRREQWDAILEQVCWVLWCDVGVVD